MSAVARERQNKLFSKSSVRAEAIQKAKEVIMPLFASKNTECKPKTQLELILKKHQNELQIDKLFKYKNWLAATGELDNEYQYRDKIVTDRVNKQTPRLRQIVTNHIIKTTIETLQQTQTQSTSKPRPLLRETSAVRPPIASRDSELADSVVRKHIDMSATRNKNKKLFSGLSTIFKSN
jgi:DNA-binding FadR family transcriptional regulator